MAREVSQKTNFDQAEVYTLEGDGRFCTLRVFDAIAISICLIAIVTIILTIVYGPLLTHFHRNKVLVTNSEMSVSDKRRAECLILVDGSLSPTSRCPDHITDVIDHLNDLLDGSPALKDAPIDERDLEPMDYEDTTESNGDNDEDDDEDGYESEYQSLDEGEPVDPSKQTDEAESKSEESDDPEAFDDEPTYDVNDEAFRKLVRETLDKRALRFPIPNIERKARQTVEEAVTNTAPKIVIPQATNRKQLLEQAESSIQQLYKAANQEQGKENLQAILKLIDQMNSSDSSKNVTGNV